MFLFYFQLYSARARRARASLLLAGVFEQRKAIFGNQLLPSQCQNDIHCETQTWISGWFHKSSVLLQTE